MKYSIISILIVTIIFVFSCKKTDEFLTQNKIGYEYDLHLIDIVSPCQVNLLFQVSYLNDGITNLNIENFEIQEDNFIISPYKSEMTVRKQLSCEYKLKTILMIDNGIGSEEFIDDIKNAALKFVDNIDFNQEVAIGVFSENATLLQEFTSDKIVLKNMINSISVSPEISDVFSGIEAGTELWNDLYSTSGVEQGFMILITNANNVQSSGTLSSALNIIDNKKVFTAGVGDDQNVDILTEIGTAGYYPDISNALLEIQNEIDTYTNSFYWLTYNSNKRGNKQHKVKLYVKNNSTISNEFIQCEYSSNNFYSENNSIVLNSGIDSLELFPDSSFTLYAETIIQDKTPEYTWQTSNSSVIAISYDQNNSSVVTLSAVGVTGQFVEIKVTDNQNNLNKTIIVSIKAAPNLFLDNRDGRYYKTVKIGNQIWMAENLSYETVGSGWLYDEDNLCLEKYGRLYTWETASDVCPAGWHLPDYEEWKALESYISNDGFDNNEGIALKATTEWFYNSSYHGTDFYGFTALPGGYRGSSGSYNDKSATARFWTSSSFDSNNSYSICLYYDSRAIHTVSLNKHNGLSVRCIKD